MAEKFYTAHTDGDDARTKLAKASSKIAKAIAHTLGPNGWHAALERGDGDSMPTITQDGATVMHDLHFEDKWESMMYEMYRDASDHISKQVGDGTTSVVVLADALLQRGMRGYAAGHSVPEVIAGMKQAVEDMLTAIEASCLRKATTEEVIRAILTVSSGDDKGITDRLTDIFLECGDSGMLIVKDSSISEDAHIFEDGYLIGMSTKNTELFDVKEDGAPKAMINWSNPYVLVVNDAVNSFKELVPLLEQILLSGDSKRLIIAYTRMDDSVIEAIRANNQSDKNELEILTIRMPMYAERQIRLQEDLAAFVDANVADKIHKAVGIDTFGLKDLGKADYMSATRYEVKLTGGRGVTTIGQTGKTILQERIELVEADRDFYTGNVQERNDANYRLARLKSSICCVYPGGHSEIEAKNRKGIYEDCIRAVQSAVKEGVVPGGGWPMYLITCNMEPDTTDSESFKFGYRCVREGAQVIFRKLCKDLDMPAELVAKKIWEAGQDDVPNYAYNFADNRVGKAIDIGVLEPFFLTKEVIRQALSIATTIMTSDGTITRHATKWYQPWKKKMQSMAHLKY